MKKSFIILLALAGCHNHGPSTDWPGYGGNKQNNRYSPLAQIDTGNVKRLTVAWTYNSADTAGGNKHPHEIQCQPIVIEGLLYGIGPNLNAFAVNAATGKQLWSFDPFKGEQPRFNQCRGVTYWSSPDGSDKRILYVAGTNLIALDAKTGLPVSSFGTNGRVSLFTGLDLNHAVKDLYVTTTSPGVVYKNTIIMGSAVSEAGDAAPGYVRGFDVITGRLSWTFHTIPQPGDPGYDTWPKDAYKWVGGTNNWGGLAVDDKRGLVYFGTGSPSSDFYGGARAGENLFSDCILALDAATGKLRWYYQTIHHDLWDRDIPCPPNLATIKHNGLPIDVVVQVTKDGNVFVLDRDSGTSVFPVEERPVPTNGLPGEQPWPTQRFPVKPAPFSKQFVSDSDIVDLDPQSHDYIQHIFSQNDYGQKFLPPNTKGTILVGYSGGAEWGGNAVDSSGILYQNANNIPWVLKMVSMAERQKEIAALSKGQGLYVANCAACHGPDRKGNGLEIPSLLGLGNRLRQEDIARIVAAGQGRMPSFKTTLSETDRGAIIDFLINTGHGGARVAVLHKDSAAQHKQNRAQPDSAHDFPYRPPYISKVWEKLETRDGYPGIKPPWGTLNAIDLNTGDYLWKVPLGEYPALTKKGIPVTGTESYGGPLATAGGLIFIAGTRDEKIRAFDRHTGHQLWEYQLPAGGFATPITYSIDGRQFIVIAAGGGRGLKTSGAYIAFALPE
jgi:quinoprotein glucose dehydrogenase